MSKRFLNTTFSFLVFFLLCYIFQSKTIDTIREEGSSINNSSVVYKTPISNSDFWSFFLMAEIEDEVGGGKNDSSTKYLTVSYLYFNLTLFNINSLLSSSFAERTILCRRYGMPIYRALKNFRI